MKSNITTIGTRRFTHMQRHEIDGDFLKFNHTFYCLDNVLKQEWLILGYL